LSSQSQYFSCGGEVSGLEPKYVTDQLKKEEEEMFLVFFVKQIAFIILAVLFNQPS
jgi:hypothetical protein